MTQHDLVALALRVESGSGADRELDLALHVVRTGREHEWSGLHDIIPGPRDLALPTIPAGADPDLVHWLRTEDDDFAPVVVPRYTTSLDAVVRLIEEKLPGWHWSAYDTNGSGKACGQVEPPEFSFAPFNGEANPPARALLAAALRAMKEEGR